MEGLNVPLIILLPIDPKGGFPQCDPCELFRPVDLPPHWAPVAVAPVLGPGDVGK